jgi:triosephosphate isomerase (TIM)
MMNERKSLVAANWKMFKTLSEAVSFTELLQREVGPIEDREVVIAPPFTALAAVRNAIWRTDFKLAAQNCHWEEKGAFTGEISGAMLRDVGCDYVILGHSERRHLFGETNEMIQKKLAAVFRFGMLPMLCVGEVLAERESGNTFTVIGTQLDRALRELPAEQACQLAIAYEPVWAIGTGKTATPEQAQEVHAFIRERCIARWDKMVANRIRIMYGGSVKPDNVDALMSQSDIDGMLVGGASLEVTSFKRIVQYQPPGETN